MVFDNIKIILDDNLKDNIRYIEIMDQHNQIKVEFTNSSILYVVYNSVGEYAYQLIFSSDKHDRIRFDSMDIKWDVPTKPNHFHPRFSREGFSSPMTGNYLHDMPILLDLIKSNKLLDESIRF